MNILIIGEFSAFAKHLKNGFKQLGHNVCIVKDGDGFKKIEPDFDDILYKNENLQLFGMSIPHTNALLASLKRWIIEIKIKKRFNKENIDLIIVINYRFLSSGCFSNGISISYIDKCKKKGAKLIKTACGGDPAFRQTFPDLMKIWGFDSHKDENDERFHFLITKADCIIPTIFSYYQSMKSYCLNHNLKCNIHLPIQLPITIDENYSIKPCVGRKIHIFHGVIRSREKGTPIIQAAMERLQSNYPDKVTCICKGGMPYDEYIRIFDDVDILVDQTYQNGYGVNAVIGAMKGKCVLAPCGKENGELMNIPNIPFVKIGPDSNEIYDVLESLILNPEKIDEIKRQSRDFIVKYCDCKIVAKKYLEALNKNI